MHCTRVMQPPVSPPISTSPTTFSPRYWPTPAAAAQMTSTPSNGSYRPTNFFACHSHSPSATTRSSPPSGAKPAPNSSPANSHSPTRYSAVLAGAPHDTPMAVDSSVDGLSTVMREWRPLRFGSLESPSNHLATQPKSQSSSGASTPVHRHQKHQKHHHHNQDLKHLSAEASQQQTPRQDAWTQMPSSSASSSARSLPYFNPSIEPFQPQQALQPSVYLPPYLLSQQQPILHHPTSMPPPQQQQQQPLDSMDTDIVVDPSTNTMVIDGDNDNVDDGDDEEDDDDDDDPILITSATNTEWSLSTAERACGPGRAQYRPNQRHRKRRPSSIIVCESLPTRFVSRAS